MCLTVNFFTMRRVAKADIDVYKFVLPTKTGFVTPYQRTYINIGGKYTSAINRINSCEITQGLHSFKTYKECLNYVKVNYWDNAVIVKCTIPKGSCYYRGKFDGSKSLVSDTLIYDRVCDSINF